MPNNYCPYCGRFMQMREFVHACDQTNKLRNYREFCTRCGATLRAETYDDFDKGLCHVCRGKIEG